MHGERVADWIQYDLTWSQYPVCTPFVPCSSGCIELRSHVGSQEQGSTWGPAYRGVAPGNLSFLQGMDRATGLVLGLLCCH